MSFLDTVWLGFWVPSTKLLLTTLLYHKKTHIKIKNFNKIKKSIWQFLANILLTRVKKKPGITGNFPVKSRIFLVFIIWRQMAFCYPNKHVLLYLAYWDKCCQILFYLNRSCCYKLHKPFQIFRQYLDIDLSKTCCLD